MSEFRVLHFGYSANLGGVEVFIKNLIMNSSISHDIVVTTEDKVPFEDELSSRGTKFIRIPPRRDNFIAYKKNIDNLLKAHQEYNIIHCHINTASIIEPIIVSKSNGRKTICHSHNSNAAFGKISKVLHHINRKRLNKIADVKLACSKMAGEFMFENDFTVIPNGIETNKFLYNELYRKELREEFEISEDEFAILHVGILSPIKNQIFLLDCFAKIIQFKPQARLVLVGVGEMMQELKEKAEALGIINKVVFAGRRTDVYKFYSMADVFVMPSLFEGFPVTLVEAQASGLKCIVSDNISKETDICNCVNFLSLDIDKWTDMIINLKKRDKDSVIEMNEFNILNTVEIIERNFYGRK